MWLACFRTQINVFIWLWHLLWSMDLNALFASGIFKYLLIKPDNFKLLCTAFLVYSYSASQLNRCPISGGGLAIWKVRFCCFCSSCVASCLWKTFSLLLTFFVFSGTKIPRQIKILCSVVKWRAEWFKKQDFFWRLMLVILVDGRQVAFPWLPAEWADDPHVTQDERGARVPLLS